MATKKRKPRACKLTPNKNISFPIGSILAVKQYYEKLRFQLIFSKFKSKGVDLNSLIEGLISYKLTENLSIVKASDWMNRKEVLEIFGIRSFEQKTLYRVLEILGENREEIMMDLQDRLFGTYNFEHTNINMDWTSIVLHGEKCPIAKYGYSRDHRPDKKQITVGVSELSSPINVPIGMTVREGNVNDQVHFTDTFEQVIGRLSEGSLVVFDQGANRKANLDKVEARKMKFVTARQLNKSDDATWIKFFDKTKAELVDERNGIYGLKKEFPSRINHLYFSEKLHHEHMESKLRKVDRLFNEAELIQKSLEKNRRLPKKYRINNPLIDCEYSYQTKLSLIDKNHAKEILKKACITGREGFFCIVTNIDLTLFEALRIYRQKNSIEMIFDSLKNEIEIKPLRVWTDISIYGALIIGYIAQLMMSLIRFDHQELKHTSVKFIKYSLMNLTVTIEKAKRGLRRAIYSNFDPISTQILGINAGIG